MNKNYFWPFLTCFQMFSLSSEQSGLSFAELLEKCVASDGKQSYRPSVHDGKMIEQTCIRVCAPAALNDVLKQCRG